LYLALSCYRIVLFAYFDFVVEMQDKLRNEQLAKLKAEEDAKTRLNDCTKHYENQIRTMRQNHEQVLSIIPSFFAASAVAVTNTKCWLCFCCT
jgi:hypothetical protein